MSGAREAILARVRRACAARGPAAAGAAVPEPAGTPSPGRREVFLAALQRCDATARVLGAREYVPAEVLRYLDERGLSGPVAIAPDPLLTQVAAALPGAHTGAAAADTQVGVSVARAGLADTGTLVLASGPDTPTTLALLPEHAVVVLEQAHLLDSLSQLWPWLAGKGLPRALNLLTGPSRTADIEQTIALGAHGPRSLHVLLLAD